MIARGALGFVATAIILATALPCAARPGDGRVLLDLQGELDPRMDLVLLDASGAEWTVLPAGQPVDGQQTRWRAWPQPQPQDQVDGGPRRFGLEPVAPGLARLEVRFPGRGVIQSWEITVGAETVSAYHLDLEGGVLLSSPVSPAPFGDQETWTRREIQLLPGDGPEGALELGAVPGAPVDPAVDGIAIRRPARLRPGVYNLEDDVVAVQVPQGLFPATVGPATPWIVTGRPPERRGQFLLMGGTSNHGVGQIRGQWNGVLETVGPFSLTGIVQGERDDDAGPAGLIKDGLPHNSLESVATRLRGSLLAGPGRLRFDFYAQGASRDHYLHEYLRNTTHAPREERADLLGRLSYDRAMEFGHLSLDAGYRRAFVETGDGEAFDRFENYRIGDPNDNQSVTPDRLYWWGGASTSPVRPHLYNYYARDLTTAFSLRGEAVLHPGASSPLRLGAEMAWITYRWYEHLDPIAAAYQGVAGGGFEYASHLGYDLTGDAQSDEDPHGPRKPRNSVLFASQSARLGPADLEVGLRYERFTPGQAAPADLGRPVDFGIEGDERAVFVLQEEETQDGIDPRIGLHFGGERWGHLWVDGGRTRQIPPYEALYYSPNVVEAWARTAAEQQVRTAENLIFGNPALSPEVRDEVHAGLFHEFGTAFAARISGRLAWTSDTWAARRFDAGVDSLGWYVNAGSRRERSLHLGLQIRPMSSLQVRFHYDLSRIETDVIEPAPLYRGWLVSDTPVEGTGTPETAPLAPVWFDDGVDRGWFPSLLDRTHRFSVALSGRFSPEALGPVAGPILGNTDLALVIKAASGTPYTPTFVQASGLMPVEGVVPAGGALSPGTPIPEQGINSGRMPWTWQLDLGLRRELPLWGGQLAIMIEGRNLTDEKMVRRVYGATGEPDEDGWLESAEGRGYLEQLGDEAPAFSAAYAERLDNPLHYQDGRTWRAGVSYAF